ncbi:hypothetical protein [Methanosarcina barkeri]|uniref:hypothetical protein n=1 Tax=Methanosarcina barkeri TaxID=2208 RepID=UPI000038599E|nr:hypothetical protein [Methanosarcina barkeri]
MARIYPIACSGVHQRNFDFTNLATSFEQMDVEHVAELLRPKDVPEIIEFFF